MNDKNKSKGQLIDELAKLRQENIDLNEQELRKSERELFNLMGSLHGMVYYCLNDQDWTMKFVSEGSLDLTGYLPDELTNNKVIAYNDLIHPDDRKAVFETVQDGLAQKTAYQIEYRIITKNNAVKYVLEHGQGIFTPDGKLHLLQGFITDITARKQSGEVLRHNLAAQALILEISKNFNNTAVEDIDEMINTTLRMIGEFDHNDRCYVAEFYDDQYTVSGTHEWCAEGIAAGIENLKRLPIRSNFPWMKNNLLSLEYTHIPRVADLPPEAKAEKEMMQAQSIQSLLAVPMLLEDKIIGFLGFASVRSEKTWSKENVIILEAVAQIIAKALQRKKSAQALQASENYYRTIFENTGAATMIIEEDMTISRVNADWERAFGFKKEDLIAKKWSDFVVGDMVETMKEYHRLRRIDPTSAPSKYISQVKDKQGKIRDGLTQVDIIPGTNKSVATFIDVTDFNRIDRALKAISVVNSAIIQAENEQDLLQKVCQKIVEVGGYSLAWVGYLQEDQPHKLQPVAHAGRNSDYLTKVNISLQAPKRKRGTIAAALQTGQPIVCRDLEKNGIAPWLKDTLRQGFKSNMAIPLMVDNKVFGAVTIYADQIDAFDNEEQKLLLDMANNLAYAIMSLRARTEKNQTAQKLEMSVEKMQRILMQAVSSLGIILDIKDPYTAGHQRNVALLAAAIAEEMGCSKAQIEGISVAGNLHDIGKIKVPSEILAKPGNLSDIEYAHIRNHSQAGYEIVKDIEFPWPVAEVLLQHHEKMDGSGYPRGLVGEEIIIEARIMAVADVVEAMTSHRPYRPGRGIDAALKEIVKRRGIRYDPDVVDACLKLFKEKDFKLE